MVLKSGPVGEYDRRLVILTRERGKITAFARGSKRPGSSLMAVSQPFVFGKFKLYEGRDSYSLASAEVKNYFTEIGEDVEAACYGSYFLEFADYYGRENMEGTELLLLLYQSMRALLKPSLPNPLIRTVFELRPCPILWFSWCLSCGPWLLMESIRRIRLKRWETRRLMRGSLLYLHRLKGCIPLC